MVNNNGSTGGNKFMHGFLWGALIGGGVVFLLGTKKGKKIIKTLSEEGLELSELLGDGEEEEVEEIVVSPRKNHKPDVKEEIDELEEDNETEQEEIKESNGVKKTGTISKIVSSPRRFFRGVPKKS